MLGDFSHAYTVDKFLTDLSDYFHGEVDFEWDKIRADVSVPGRLDALVALALKNKTHPVSEFVREMLRDSSRDFNLDQP